MLIDDWHAKRAIQWYSLDVKRKRSRPLVTWRSTLKKEFSLNKTHDRKTEVIGYPTCHQLREKSKFRGNERTNNLNSHQTPKARLIAPIPNWKDTEEGAILDQTKYRFRENCLDMYRTEEFKDKKERQRRRYGVEEALFGIHVESIFQLECCRSRRRFTKWGREKKRSWNIW